MRTIARDTRQERDWNDGLSTGLESVLARWRQMLVYEQPWSEMLYADLNGAMPRILAELLDLARDPKQTERRRWMVLACRDHGAFRRAQGCPGDPMRLEFARPAVALRAALQSEGLSAAAATDALRVLEADLNLARLAAAQAFDTGGH